MRRTTLLYQDAPIEWSDWVGGRGDAGKSGDDGDEGEAIRVLIVDDHKLFADALRPILESHGITVLGVAGSGREALEAARRERPDIVLMDLGLPDERGIDAGRKILGELADVKVIAVTAMDEPAVVREAVGAGFQGYLTKDLSVPQFIRSIRAAAENQVVIPRRLARAAAGSRSEEDVEALLLARQLTNRERQVLAMLVEGAQSSEIARRLWVSPRTVRTHVHNILTKLQVHSRLQAAAFAIRNGIVKVSRDDPPS